MHITPFSILALALAIAHGGAAAADIPEGTWSTAAELGAIATSGNTVGASITGKIDARQELDDWSNQYIFTGYFKEDEKNLDDGDKIRVRSAERFSVSAKAAYKLLDRSEKLFVLGSHVDDKFGAYTTFSTMAIGHSSQWYKSPDATIDIELGPGYFNGTRASGESESGFTVRGAAALKWKLSTSALFSQTVSVELNYEDKIPEITEVNNAIAFVPNKLPPPLRSSTHILPFNAMVAKRQKLSPIPLPRSAAL